MALRCYQSPFPAVYGVSHSDGNGGPFELHFPVDNRMVRGPCSAHATRLDVCVSGCAADGLEAVRPAGGFSLSTHLRTARPFTAGSYPDIRSWSRDSPWGDPGPSRQEGL
jgi:hypothetical protein